MYYCEYGSYILQYAKNRKIPYYYLTPDGVNSPSGPLYKGDSYVLYGYARSSVNLTEVTATIWDSTGSNAIQTVTVNPATTDYNLSGTINANLHFGTLPLGNYRYTLRARTDVSEELWADNSFKIVPPPLRIYLSGYNLTSGIVDASSISTISGTVISNYIITSLTVQVFQSNGQQIYGKTVTPNTTTYSLSGFAGDIPISQLPIGEYSIRITAVSNGETRLLADNTFSPVDMSTAVDASTLAAVTRFVSNSSNAQVFTGAYVNNAMSKLGTKEILLMAVNSRNDWVYGMASTLFSENGENLYLVDLYESEIADIIAAMNPNTIEIPNIDKTFKFVADQLVEIGELNIAWKEQLNIANDI